MPLPNALSWMESADAKMIRAQENIEGIDREINEWSASIKVNMFLKTAADNPSPWLVVNANDYIPPIRFSVLIGECVHNMRSAVDNLVCGLARTLKPTCKCAELAFPLLADQEEWDKKADKSLRGIPPAAKFFRVFGGGSDQAAHHVSVAGEKVGGVRHRSRLPLSDSALGAPKSAVLPRRSAG